MSSNVSDKTIEHVRTIRRREKRRKEEESTVRGTEIRKGMDDLESVSSQWLEL